MSFCRDQHRHNYGGRKRCPFFHFFANERKKTKNKTKRPKKWTHTRSDDLFLHTHNAHSPETQSGEEEEDKEEEEEEDEEKNNSALYSYIVLSHLLKQISSSLEVVVFYDSVKARTFFLLLHQRSRTALVPFSTQNSTTTRTTTNHNHKR